MSIDTTGLRAILREQRSARLIGITRGSIGQDHATALCGGRTDAPRDHLGRLVCSGPGPVDAPVREITDEQRAERRITGTEPRPWLQGIADQQHMGTAIAALVRTATMPQHLPLGPAALEPTRRKFHPRVERARKQAAQEQRAAADTQRQTERAAKAGLDMRDPRQARRAAARLERAQAKQRSASSLDAYLAAERECGRAV